MNRKSIFGTIGAAARCENKFEISAYGRTYDNKKIDGVISGATISTEQKAIQTKREQIENFVIESANRIKWNGPRNLFEVF